jgi:hypothetical protein
LQSLKTGEFKWEGLTLGEKCFAHSIRKVVDVVSSVLPQSGARHQIMKTMQMH